MKKILLLMLLLTTWCGMTAAPVTLQQALQKAKQFRANKEFKTPKRMKKSPKAGQTATDEPAFYVFNAEGNKGFVIVSGDDRTEPILGYADQGRLDMDDMPDNLKSWLQGYADQISELDSNNTLRKAARTPRPAVSPMLTTKWNQSSPYNLQCPEYNGELSITGCVATAMAQVMNYYKWPDDTTTNIPAYTTKTLGIQVDELPTTTFNWNAMKDTYSKNDTGEAVDAVAELMRYCGQAVEMDYGLTGSGASTSDMPIALMKYFGYKKSARVVNRSEYSTKEWEDKIYQEIATQHPVLYRGSNIEGHAFVCDGCDAEGLFHINWGWGGKYDGYFSLSLLNPDIEINGYTVGQAALLGLDPAKSGDATTGTAVVKGYSTSSNSYNRNSLIRDFHSVWLEGSVKSYYENCVLDCGWALYQDGDFIQLLAQFPNASLTTESNYSISTYADFGAGMTDGDYEIYMVYSQPGTDEWVKCVDAGLYPIKANITENKLTVKGVEIADNILVNSAALSTDNDYLTSHPQTILLNFTNNGTTHEQTFYVWMNGNNVARKSAHLDSGETSDFSIQFMPIPGTMILNVTTDANGSNVVFSQDITISLDKTLKDGDFFVSQTAEGVPMTFKVVSATDKTCQIGDGSSAAVLTNTTGSVTIPTVVEGFTVVDIAANAFRECNSITSVIFPQAFANCRPTTTQCWFYNCTSLQAIEGLEYVNTSEVTDMGWMFYYCSNLTNLNISSFNTSKVTNMYSMFCGCSKLTSLNLSNFETSNVTRMQFMFEYCSGLTSLDLSSFNTGNVTTMQYMFYDCSGLTSLDLSNFNMTNVTASYNMCMDCTSLKQITLPSTMMTIGSSAFYNCSELTNIIIPSSVSSINSYAFYGCSALNSVSISEGVTSIGSNAFQNCSGLTSITIPSSVINIDYSAFYKCIGLTNLVISEGVTSIGSSAFYNCNNLTSITIPSSVTNIGYSAFNNCIGLTNLVISEGVTSIGDYAFQNCSGLTSITIPSTVNSIGDDAFRRCTNLNSIIVAAGNSVYDSRENCNAINETAKNVLIQGCSKTVIPSSVTCIGNEAFSNCSGLASITIPEGVTSIGNYAFLRCSGLASITIPEGVTSIGNYAFSNCSGLTSIAIPSSVNDIGYNAFESCSSLTSITIYGNSTSIGNSAFENCSALTNVIISEGITGIGNYAFYGCSELKSISIPSSVSSIGTQAFYNCSNLIEINIPSSVISIGSRAFYGTGWYNNQPYGLLYLDNWLLGYKGYGLSGNVAIDEGTKRIANYAFYDYNNLTSVSIPESVIIIGEGAFEKCAGLTSVTIPNSVTSISDYCFKNCRDLSIITIPSSVTSIGQEAFYGCSSLSDINIPSSVISIGSSAFYSTYWYSNQPNGVLYLDNWLLGYKGYKGVKPYGVFIIEEGTRGICDQALDYCDGLTSVSIPEGVSFIGSEAFSNCHRLNSVCIPSSVTSIGNNAFYGCSLTSITSLIKNPFIINYYVFYSSTSTYSNATLYVPQGTIAKYEATPAWNEFLNIIEIESIPAIPGDLNNDGVVNGTDLVTQTNLILNDQYSTNADLNNDGVVNGTDYVLMVIDIMNFSAAPAMMAAANNRAASTASLSIEDFNIKAGETKEMFINLSNPDTELTLLQFDLRLPDGLSIVEEGGEYAVDIAGRTTWRKHSLTTNAVDGITRFLLASNNNATFSGDSGNIISIKLTAANDFSFGDIRLENQLLVTPDAEETKPAEYIYSIGGTTTIDGVRGSQPAEVYTLTGNKVRQAGTALDGLTKGVYIIKGKKVIVK